MNIFDVMYENFKFDKGKPLSYLKHFLVMVVMALKRLGVNDSVVGYRDR